MKDDLAENKRRREIAVLLARGLARAAKTCESVIASDDESKVTQTELAIAEGGER